MKKSHLVKQLQTELNAMPIPDVIEKVRLKSSIIPKNENKATLKHSFSLRVAASFMAIVFIVFALYAAIFPFLKNNEYTTITIDINPSLELVLNEKEEVVEIVAVNNDASTLLNNVNILGEKLDLAVEHLLDKAIELNFINSESENAILFSVQNKNAVKFNQIKQKIENKANNYLQGRGVSNTVLFEEYNEALREEYNNLKDNFEENINITPAKYQYIKRILTRFPNLIGHEEYLAKMSVGQLNYLLTATSTNNPNLDNLIDQILQNIGGNGGNAGNGGYIGGSGK